MTQRHRLTVLERVPAIDPAARQGPTPGAAAESWPTGRLIMIQSVAEVRSLTGSDAKPAFSVAYADFRSRHVADRTPAIFLGVQEDPICIVRVFIGSRCTSLGCAFSVSDALAVGISIPRPMTGFYWVVLKRDAG